MKKLKVYIHSRDRVMQKKKKILNRIMGDGTLVFPLDWGVGVSF